MPHHLSELALRALGVSEALIQEIYGLDPAELRSVLDCALEQGTEARFNASTDPEHRYEMSPFGMPDLRRLLTEPSIPVLRETFSFSWRPASGIASRVILNGKDTYVSEPDGKHLTLDTSANFQAWCEELRRCFARTEPMNYLILLLPKTQNQDKSKQWEMLSLSADRPDNKAAIQLLSALTILGLSHRKGGSRTKFLGGLVKHNELLFDAIGVCGSASSDLPGDQLLVRQMAGMPDQLLMLSPLINHGKEVARPYVVSFSDAWNDEPARFSDWSVRARAADADDCADALLWLITQTSGVAVKIPLLPRRCKKVSDAHNLRVVAPTPWTDFLRQGHGAQRKDPAKVFEPYLSRENPSVPLYCVDEPKRFEEVKSDQVKAEQVKAEQQLHEATLYPKGQQKQS